MSPHRSPIWMPRGKETTSSESWEQAVACFGWQVKKMGRIAKQKPRGWGSRGPPPRSNFELHPPSFWFLSNTLKMLWLLLLLEVISHLFASLGWTPEPGRGSPPRSSSRRSIGRTSSALAAGPGGGRTASWCLRCPWGRRRCRPSPSTTHRIPSASQWSEFAFFSPSPQGPEIGLQKSLKFHGGGWVGRPPPPPSWLLGGSTPRGLPVFPGAPIFSPLVPKELSFRGWVTPGGLTPPPTPLYG